MKFKTRIKKNLTFNIFGLILWAVLLTVITLCFTAKVETNSFGVFASYFLKPSIFLVNFLPVLVVTLFFAFVTNSVWVTFIISSFVTLSLTMVNYFKLILRNDPFVMADFALFGEALNISERYTLTLDLFFFVAIGVVVAGVVFAKSWFRYRSKNRITRLVGAALCVLVLALAIKPVYLSDTVYQKLENIEPNPHMNALDTNDQFASRGFVYSFIHSFGDVFETPPKGYSDDIAKELISQYTYDNIPDDKKVNVISIMLEAFNDFSKFDTVKFSNNPYTYLHKLQKKSVYGEVFSNVFGGGTINSERSFITGYSTQTDYRKSTNSYVHYLREQGYTVEGGHPGHEWFYSRDLVNKFLGFENYKFFETGYEDIYNSNPNNGDNILDDQYLFEEILDSFEANKATGKPYFNFSVCYQNHGPYSMSFLQDGVEYVRKTNGMSVESYNIVNNYLSGIKRTIDAIEKLVNKIDAMDEPVMLVLFGDHNPWLGNENFVYKEMGINLDFSQGNGLYNYFSVPYIIYTNDAAKKMTENYEVGYGGDFGMMYLMNKVFEINGWQGNEFMKASNDMKESFDIITNIGLYRENGVLSPDTSSEATDKYNKFRIIQYYWRNKIAP